MSSRVFPKLFYHHHLSKKLDMENKKLNICKFASVNLFRDGRNIMITNEKQTTPGPVVSNNERMASSSNQMDRNVTESLFQLKPNVAEMINDLLKLTCPKDQSTRIELKQKHEIEGRLGSLGKPNIAPNISCGQYPLHSPPRPWVSPYFSEGSSSFEHGNSKGEKNGGYLDTKVASEYRNFGYIYEQGSYRQPLPTPSQKSPTAYSLSRATSPSSDKDEKKPSAYRKTGSVLGKGQAKLRLRAFMQSQVSIRPKMRVASVFNENDQDEGKEMRPVVKQATPVMDQLMKDELQKKKAVEAAIEAKRKREDDLKKAMERKVMSECEMVTVMMCTKEDFKQVHGKERGVSDTGNDTDKMEVPKKYIRLTSDGIMFSFNEATNEMQD